MIKEGLLAAAAISTLGGAALGATSVAAAQGEPGNGHMSNLVEAIAEHFNVSTDEVQAIFDAEREEMRANMEARAQEKLQEAVDAGTLTQPDR